MACRGVTDPDVAQGGGVPRLHLAQGGGCAKGAVLCGPCGAKKQNF